MTGPSSLAREHGALIALYGQVQSRCSAVIAAQAAQIERLQAETLRLRAALIVRETALAFERADRLEREATIPGLGDLREKSVLCIGEAGPDSVAAQLAVERAGGLFLRHDGEAPADGDGGAALEASLVAADLVICQTGCVSHDAYWRVQDHCRRTGKQCVLVDQPQAMQFVRSLRAIARPAFEERS